MTSFVSVAPSQAENCQSPRGGGLEGRDGERKRACGMVAGMSAVDATSLPGSPLLISARAVLVRPL